MVYQLEKEGLSLTKSPGVDYQYVGFNMRDPVLKDVRVRHAIGHAIDRQAIVDYLRRGLATVADSMLPPTNWAYEPNVAVLEYDPERAKALLDEAGYPDPDGDGPRPRLSLSLQNHERRVLPPAGGSHSAESARRRHRARRAIVRVRHAVRRHSEGQLSDVFAAVGRRRARRPRYPSTRVSLSAGTARRIQSRSLQRSGSRSPDRRSIEGDRLRDAPAALRKGSAAARRRRALHQPLAPNQLRARAAEHSRASASRRRATSRFCETSRARSNIVHA